MGKTLKLCSGSEAVRKLRKAGWTVARLSIPQHAELGPGLLRSLIRQAGLTVGEFNDL
jgi:predicted RNA binding protein YcfA (HicA-like mRNA interferase family)